MTFSKESEHNDVHKNIFPNSTPYSDVTFVIQAKREKKIWKALILQSS